MYDIVKMGWKRKEKIEKIIKRKSEGGEEIVGIIKKGQDL